VCIVGDAHASAIQAVLRVDPAGFAVRELGDRTAAGLPPSAFFVEATGEPAVVADFVSVLEPPLPGDVFGPVDIPPLEGQASQRMLWRCEPVDAPALVSAIKAAMARRSAVKAPGVVRVQVDPSEMD